MTARVLDDTDDSLEGKGMKMNSFPNLISTCVCAIVEDQLYGDVPASRISCQVPRSLRAGQSVDVVCY